VIQNKTKTPQNSSRRGLGATSTGETETPVLADIFPVSVSSKRVMVELRGFEPLTPSMRNLGIAVYAGRFGHSVAILGRCGSVRVDVVAGSTAGTAITGSAVPSTDRGYLFMPSVLPRCGENRIPQLHPSEHPGPIDVWVLVRSRLGIREFRMVGLAARDRRRCTSQLRPVRSRAARPTRPCSRSQSARHLRRDAGRARRLPVRCGADLPRPRSPPPEERHRPTAALRASANSKGTQSRLQSGPRRDAREVR